MKKIITTLAMFTSLGLYAQNNVGIGTLTPNANAKLEVKSDDKGVLITRLTTVARNTLGTNLTAVEDGMLVYDKDLTAFYYWDGPNLQWVVVGNGAGSDNQNIDNFSFDNTTNILTIEIEDGNIQTVDLTDLLNDGDADPTNEIELPATATTGQVLSWDGTNWVAQNASSGADNWGSDVVHTTGVNISGDGTTGNPITVTDGDSDATNEIELPTGGTNGQVLSTDGSGVYSWISDNAGTDDQNIANLAFDNTTNILTVGIENGTAQTIDLSSLVNDADNSITNEIQDLSINTTTNILTITNNGSATNIDLSSYLDNTDNQDLSLTGNTLSLTNDGTTVDLSGYMDNTDAQNIAGSSFTTSTGDLVIGISNGTNQTINLNGLKDHDWYEVGTTRGADNIGDNIFTQGNVGIGLTNPTSKLDVNGDILYSGNTMTHFKITSASDDIYLDMIKVSTNSANARIMFDGYGAPQDQGQIRFFTRWDVANGGTGSLNHVMSLMETGNVGIGTTIPNASALLDVNSSNKGFLPPRVALTGNNDITTIASPATGLLVYNTNSSGVGVNTVEPGYYYFNGTIWKTVGENSDWYLDNTNSFTGSLSLITSATVSTTGNRLYTNYVNLQKGVYFVNFYDCLSSATSNYYVQTRAESSSPNNLVSGSMNYDFSARTNYSHAGFVIYVRSNGTPVRFFVYNPSSSTQTLTIPKTVQSCSGFQYYKISE